MTFVLDRIRRFAALAGDDRREALAALLRKRPHLVRAFVEGRPPAMARAAAEICDLTRIETLAHSRRLELWCDMLAEAMGLASDFRLQLRFGALFHDIGKIAVESSILDDENPLDPLGLDAIQTHPGIGHTIMFGQPSLHGAAEMVLAHHEYWDGSGYPRGLRGEDIPLSARIFAIVDTYDAMLRIDRPYRSAVSHDEAIDELSRLSDTKYDPEIVDALLGLDLVAWHALFSEIPDPVTIDSCTPTTRLSIA